MTTAPHVGEIRPNPAAIAESTVREWFPLASHDDVVLSVPRHRLVTLVTEAALIASSSTSKQNTEGKRPVPPYVHDLEDCSAQFGRALALLRMICGACLKEGAVSETDISDAVWGVDTDLMGPAIAKLDQAIEAVFSECRGEGATEAGPRGAHGDPHR